MLHEFEEVIRVAGWTKRNAAYISTRKSKFIPYKASVSTPSFALALAKEWLLICLITGAALYFHNYFLWYGLLFVPGNATAVLFLRPGVFLLVTAASILHFGWRTALLSALTGTVIGLLNLRLVHMATSHSLGLNRRLYGKCRLR
jgi:hypothetical protein